MTTCPPGFHVETVEICVEDPPPPAEPSWSSYGPIVVIADSPTALARGIVQLHPFNSRIYLGYGDWNDTKQPGCHLIGFDPVKKDIVDHGLFATDAFWSLRTAGNELWALMTDPEVGTNPDVVVVRQDDQVEVIAAAMLNPWHLFDVVMWRGQPWVAGSISVSGSVDAQGVWTRFMTTAGERWKIAWQGPNGRAYALFVLNDLLHVMTSWGRMYQTGDGVNWTQVAGTFAAVATKPMSYQDKVVYRGYWPGSGSGYLYSNDGVKQSALIGGVRDHFVDAEGCLWLLSSGGVISKDFVSVVDAPANAVSLCVDNGVIYVGTSDSMVWMFA